MKFSVWPLLLILAIGGLGLFTLFSTPNIQQMKRVRSPEEKCDATIDIASKGLFGSDVRTRVSIERVTGAFRMFSQEIILETDNEEAASDIRLSWLQENVLDVELPPHINLIKKRQQLDGIKVFFKERQ